MTFPQSPRVVYEQDTLSQVVCALAFPPILSIGTETPTALQEALRGEYPLYETRPAGGGQIQIDGDDPRPMLQVLSQIGLGQQQMPQQHRFSTEDQSRTVVVGPRLLALEDTSYTEWPRFSANMGVARTAVEDIYRPAFYSRVGLRYQDVIRKEMLKESSKWTDLIQPTFLGLLGTEDVSTIKEVGTAALIALDRSGSFVRLNHGLAIDEDTQESVYIIDADFYTEERQDGTDIEDLLGYFRAEAGNLFRWAITPALHDALGPREGDPSP